MSLSSTNNLQMNSKLTLPDLIAALSGSANVSRALSERFIKSLFSIIAEAAVNGENIKIKGLGTFKVSDVEERKSVNVNTGAEMIIPAHRKISFSPDKSLSELINAPFSLFEPVELDDDVSEQMLARADEPAEQQQSGMTERQQPIREEEVCTPVESIADSTPADTHNTVEALTDVPAMHEFDMAPAEKDADPKEEMPVEPIEETPASEETPAPVQPTEDSSSCAHVSEKPEIMKKDSPACHQEGLATEAEEIIADDKKVEIHLHSPECHAPRFRRGIYIGMAAAAVLLLAVMAAWRLLLPDSFCMVTGTMLPPSQSELIAGKAIPATPIETAAVVAPTQSADTIAAEEAIKPVETSENGAGEKAAPTKASDAQDAKGEKKVYDTITRKRFLTTMAKEHYGNYNLWPFIYDENKGRLGHPDRIKPGTKVVIPPASKYNIDANDPKCVARAKKRGAEIYAKYR